MHDVNAFLDLEAPHTDAATAAVRIVPVPYERTTSFQQGTAEGPAAILRASADLEYYDELTGTVPARAGIHTTAPFTHAGDPVAFTQALRTHVADQLAADRVVGVLGGEHTVSIGPIEATAAAHPGMGVLQIDAHADLRESFGGSTHSHACVMRRALDVAPIVQVGIRSLSEPEADRIHTDERITTFFAHDLPPDLSDRVIDALPPEVYLTVDIDGLDPSEAPGTGTPEPGGLRYRDVVSLVSAVARKRRIVGFDVVEVRPLPGQMNTEFLAARLVYKIIGAIVTRGGMATPDWRHPTPTDERDP